jgi:hypothetical protein
VLERASLHAKIDAIFAGKLIFRTVTQILKFIAVPVQWRLLTKVVNKRWHKPYQIS